MEALAKSLPDLPVGKSPYAGGGGGRGWMQHNEQMGVVAFSWPFFAAAAALPDSACVKNVDVG